MFPCLMLQKLKGSESKVEEINQQLAAHKEDIEKLETKLKQEKEVRKYNVLLWNILNSWRSLYVAM